MRNSIFLDPVRHFKYVLKQSHFHTVLPDHLAETMLVCNLTLTKTRIIDLLSFVTASQSNLNVLSCAHMYVCIYALVCIYICTYVYVPVHGHMYVHRHMYVNLSSYVCMYIWPVCVHVCTYILRNLHSLKVRVWNTMRI